MKPKHPAASFPLTSLMGGKLPVIAPAPVVKMAAKPSGRHPHVNLGKYLHPKKK